MILGLRGSGGMAVLLGALALPCHSADVGGWFADQQKAAAIGAASAGDDGCPHLVARAGTDGSSLAAYRAALCYLQPGSADPVAAKAWLARSAEAGFLPAHRVLRSLLIAEAGLHGGAPHCHELGEGQRLCHGGGARPPGAAAAGAATQ